MGRQSSFCTQTLKFEELQYLLCQKLSSPIFSSTGILKIVMALQADGGGRCVAGVIQQKTCHEVSTWNDPFSMLVLSALIPT